VIRLISTPWLKVVVSACRDIFRLVTSVQISLAVWLQERFPMCFCVLIVTYGSISKISQLITPVSVSKDILYQTVNAWTSAGMGKDTQMNVMMAIRLVMMDAPITVLSRQISLVMALTWRSLNACISSIILSLNYHP
jgi:hypothetical protein